MHQVPDDLATHCLEIGLRAGAALADPDEVQAVARAHRTEPATDGRFLESGSELRTEGARQFGASRRPELRAASEGIAEAHGVVGSDFALAQLPQQPLGVAVERGAAIVAGEIDLRQTNAR